MPICEGCGNGYDDNFKFCPYCGRGKNRSEVPTIAVSREICYLELKKIKLDNNTAEEWIEVICNHKVIDRTPGLIFHFDKRRYRDTRFMSDWYGDLGGDVQPNKKERAWHQENSSNQYRDLIARLLFEGWEILPSEDGDNVRIMQRVINKPY